MKLQRLAFSLIGLSLVAATLTVEPAGAAIGAKPPICGSYVGWANANGTAGTAFVEPYKPPRATVYPTFKFPAARSSASWYQVHKNNETRDYFYGLYLLGSNLYRHTTYWDGLRGQPTTTRLGSGWASFKSIATAQVPYFEGVHTFLYGLNSNGRLYRYRQSGAGLTAFSAYGSFAGFKSFKSMTVASQEDSYDTLLMTTKAGALYTIHIPTTAQAKPVVKLIRSTGWAAYESLILQSCGVHFGSLVVGVDHDTDSGFQYAFSKLNGAATAITSYGKAPVKFTGTTHVAFRGNWGQLYAE
jgi:hypothetical protein